MGDRVLKAILPAIHNLFNSINIQEEAVHISLHPFFWKKQNPLFPVESKDFSQGCFGVKGKMAITYRVRVSN
jgi:hypothetical protein